MPQTLPARPKTNRLALAALIFGGVAIGGSPIFVRLSEVGPMATGFWRVALALIPFLLLSATGGDARQNRPQGLADYLWLTLPGIMLAADLASWHLALRMTSVTNATLLANMAPVFVTLIGWLLLGATVNRTFVAGLVTAIAGVVILKGGPAALGNGDLRGDGMACVAAIFYAGYILAVGRLRSRFDTVRIMLWSTASASLCMLPLALCFETTLFPPGAYGWAVLFGLALISHAGGQMAIAYALAYLPAAFSSLTLLLQPVVAAILAWSLLGEAIGGLQALGGSIVLFGILIARRA